MSQKPHVTVRRSTVDHFLAKQAGNVLLALGVTVLVVPFLIALFVALKPSAEAASDPLSWPSRITLDNFVDAFNQMNYLQGLANTLEILAGTLLVTILVGSIASYPLSRIGASWSQWAYRGFLLGTSVPIWVLLVPLYLFLRDVGLLGSYVSVVLIYSASLLPIAIFFYASFLRQVPVELEEAAAIDGAGALRVFFQIIFPLLTPITLTLITYISLAVWNDLVIPLIFLNGPSAGTLMSNAYALLNPLVVRPSTLFPAVILGVMPLFIMFFFLQRSLVAGLTSGAVK